MYFKRKRRPKRRRFSVLLIPILQTGVLVNAVQKHLPAAEFQQVKSFLLMKGYNALAGVDPDTEQVFMNSVIFHKEAPFT